MIAPTMKALRILAIGTLALLAFAVPAMAADSTPAIGDKDLGAYIREGSCDQPGKVIEDVGDLDPDDDIWDLLGQGEQEPRTIYGEDEGIRQSVDDLVGSGYIVTIHKTDDADADIIACGKIEGDVGSDGTLMIDLKEMNDSGFIGRVHFGPKHDDDEQTEVTTGVWEGSSATPEATPAG